MNIKKKLITFMLTFAMVLSLVPTMNVKAATTDFDIISDTEVTASEAKKWAESKGATDNFASLAKLYFKYAKDCGNVNPAIAYVQAAKETGYGRFGGVLDESYNNPCGMKTSSGGGDYDKDAHQKFNSWDEGVQAHMDHLALYAGAKGYPKSNTYDSRHFITLKGKASTTNGLGTKWAPSSTYGEEVGKLYMDLMDYSQVDYDTDNLNNSSNNDLDDDFSNNSDDDSDEDNNISNEAPNPGTVETKPSALNVLEVLEISKPAIKDENKDKTPNIVSTIGWKKENGNWYYYKSDETKAVGFIKPDSNWYYLNDEDGQMKTGWLKDNDNWYYLENSGVMTKGWKLLGDTWYFFKDSGSMATGIQYDGNSLYYFKDSGAMTKNNGWVKLDNKWCYSESNGKIKTGWLDENNTWYYLQGDGSMVTGLKKIDGKIYSFRENGAMETGWKQINNNWYYLDKSGQMATGWTYDGSSNYYLYDTYAMAKGWINVGGTWYCLNSNGQMTTGWVTSNGDSYYLDKVTGRLLTNTVIDGYKIGSDGKKGSKSSNSNNNTSSNNNKPTSPSNSKKTIVIDAGHDYGKDYGAEKSFDGVTYSETILDMEVADKLKTELLNRGYNVIMTRNLGEKPSFSSLTESLSYRVNVANGANADLFISIHHNSAVETAKGVETLYSSITQDAIYGGKYDDNRIEKSKNLATLINNNISNKLNLVNRGGKEQNLYVCRNTNMPAVLVETGFLTNKEEAERCADSASQQKVAEAIAEIVERNF